MKEINLFHIFVIGPYFYYLYLTYPNFNPFHYTILAVLGGILILYQGYEYLKHGRLINLVHAAIFGPFLLYTGLYQAKVPKYEYQLYQLMGIGAVGYHALKYFGY
jgi:hypothetical protein